MATPIVPLLLMLLFALVFSGFGLFVLVTVRRSYRGQQAAASERETVEATVTTSRIEPMDDGSGLYYPEIEFEYTYDGETYESSMVVEGGQERLGDRSDVEPLVDRYSTGERVEAYLYESAPDMAFLEPSTASTGLFRLAFGFLIGLVFAVVPIGLWLFIFVTNVLL